MTLQEQIDRLGKSKQKLYNQYTALHDWLEENDIELPEELYEGITPRCDFCWMRHQGNC